MLALLLRGRVFSQFGGRSFQWLTQRLPRSVVRLRLISLWAVGAGKTAAGVRRARLTMASRLLSFRTFIGLVNNIPAGSPRGYDCDQSGENEPLFDGIDCPAYNYRLWTTCDFLLSLARESLYFWENGRSH